MVQRPRQGNPTPPAILGWRERDIGERYTTIKKSGSHVTGHGRIIIIRRPPTITNLDTTSDIVEWEANTMQVTEITGGTYAAAYQYWRLHYGPYIRDMRDAIATMWRWMANTYLPWESHWDIVSGRLINLKNARGYTSVNMRDPPEYARQVNPPGVRKKSHPCLWSQSTLPGSAGRNTGRHLRDDLPLGRIPWIFRMGRAIIWRTQCDKWDKYH